MIDMLYWAGDPIAVPAFRIFAIVDGDLHSEVNAANTRSIYSKFEERFGKTATWASYNFLGHRGKYKKTTPKLLDEGRAFLNGNATQYGEGIRRYGEAFEGYPHPGIPFFGVEQRSYVHYLELAIPYDYPELVEFADLITAELMKMSVVCGAMGMGFFLPYHLDSLSHQLGQAVPRYRAILDVTPDMVTNGVRKEGSSYRWQAGEEPGIADIGWRTLIGREFWSRISDAVSTLKAEEDITVEQSDTVIAITAGKRPIWGDVNRKEDISAYRTVAKQLSPIRYPEGAAKAFMFGGGTYDANIADKIEAYLERFS